MSTWFVPEGVTAEHLGMLPQFMSEHDPRPVREQINEHYAHGGGWKPMQGFTLNTQDMTLHFNGDQPLRMIGATSVREETVFLFENDWVAIVQPGGADSPEVARID